MPPPPSSSSCHAPGQLQLQVQLVQLGLDPAPVGRDVGEQMGRPVDVRRPGQDATQLDPGHARGWGGGRAEEGGAAEILFKRNRIGLMCDYVKFYLEPFRQLSF